MRYLLLILFNAGIFYCHGQTSKVDCRLLEFSVQTDIFKERFYLCQHTSPVYIIDKITAFKNCDLKDVCKRKLQVVDNFKEKDEGNVIEIYKIDKNKSSYTLYFHRLATGATLVLKLRSKGSKFKIISYKTGAF